MRGGRLALPGSLPPVFSATTGAANVIPPSPDTATSILPLREKTTYAFPSESSASPGALALSTTLTRTVSSLGRGGGLACISRAARRSAMEGYYSRGEQDGRSVLFP